MRICSAVLLVATVGLPMEARPQTPAKIPAAHIKSGTLSFDGRASVGDFVGSTSTVSGEMTAADSVSAVRGWVESPVKTLKTGNGKRDRDLNKSMESDKYPNLRFDLASVTPGAGTADSVPVTLRGKLTIHGVSREVELPGFVRFGDGGVRVRTDFPLNLKDYQIGGLTKMLGMLKMYEDIEVHVDLTFGPS